LFDFSPIQILLVLVIALLIFGPKRLPELGRTIGRGLREFRSSVAGLDDEPAKAPAAAPAAAEPAVATTGAAPDEADEVLQGVVLRGSDPPTPRPGD
jgi:sec-independent protein translocase protein TatA